MLLLVQVQRASPSHSIHELRVSKLIRDQHLKIKCCMYPSKIIINKRNFDSYPTPKLITGKEFSKHKPSVSVVQF